VLDNVEAGGFLLFLFLVFQLSCQFLRFPDVPRLRFLVAASEKNDDFGSDLCEVDPVAGSGVDSQFPNSKGPGYLIS